MTYRLNLSSTGTFHECPDEYKNFITTLWNSQSRPVDDRAWEKYLDEYLLENHNAKYAYLEDYPGTNISELEFGSEEDYLLFVLKWG